MIEQLFGKVHSVSVTSQISERTKIRDHPERTYLTPSSVCWLIRARNNTVLGGNLFWWFCGMFSKSLQCLHGSCSAAHPGFGHGTLCYKTLWTSEQVAAPFCCCSITSALGLLLGGEFGSRKGVSRNSLLTSLFPSLSSLIRGSRAKNSPADLMQLPSFFTQRPRVRCHYCPRRRRRRNLAILG